MNFRIPLLISTCLISLPTAVHAESIFESFSAPLFQGLYTEASIGIQNHDIKIPDITGNVFISSSTTGSPSFSYGTHSLSSTPFILGFGYNYGLNNQYILGFGLDYSMLSSGSKTFSGTYVSQTSSTTSVTGSLENTSFKIKSSFDLYVAPGILLTQHKLVYLKIGYMNSSAEYIQGASTNTPTNVYSGFSKTLNISGFLLGLGYKVLITPHIYAFIEGDYDTSENYTFSGEVYGQTGNSAILTPTIKISGYRGLVGAGYKF